MQRQELIEVVSTPYATGKVVKRRGMLFTSYLVYVDDCFMSEHDSRRSAMERIYKVLGVKQGQQRRD